MVVAKFNMIKEIERFEEFNGVNSPLIPRIFSAFKYKSGSDNALKQITDDGVITAFLSSIDTNFTLIATENADLCEIKEFLEFFGCNSVVSDVPLSTSAKKYSVFKSENNNFSESCIDYCSLDITSNITQYKDFHSLLFVDNKSVFDSWYCDFSKKIVNNDAKAICLKQSGESVSVAAAPMIYKNTAIISGVYTLESYRNKGFSKLTIKKLIEELNKDNVTEIYLWCEKHLEEFYNKLGFEKVGDVYIETEF
ncbi:MAG: GNAT family N-acetyltransferase [Clostridia bacterium]|nr:GNAT family N-acetyltransferase [Clostridia bacterium]